MLKCLFAVIVVLSLSFGLRTEAATLYVDLNSAAPAPPYDSWATAATNIQDAVDAAVADDTVLVTNGMYSTGTTATPGYPA